MKDFVAQASGATAIEYALVAGLISIAILGALANLGSQMDALFTSVVTAIP